MIWKFLGIIIIFFFFCQNEFPIKYSCWRNASKKEKKRNATMFNGLLNKTSIIYQLDNFNVAVFTQIIYFDNVRVFWHRRLNISNTEKSELFHTRVYVQ